MPAHPPGLVVLEVSIDGGMSFTASGLLYQFALQGIVDITPKQGPLRGGTLLTVYGVDMYPPRGDGSTTDTSLLCKFGDVGNVVNPIILSKRLPMPNHDALEIRIRSLSRSPVFMSKYLSTGPRNHMINTQNSFPQAERRPELPDDNN